MPQPEPTDPWERTQKSGTATSFPQNPCRKRSSGGSGGSDLQTLPPCGRPWCERSSLQGVGTVMGVKVESIESSVQTCQRQKGWCRNYVGFLQSPTHGGRNFQSDVLRPWAGTRLSLHLPAQFWTFNLPSPRLC